MNTLPKLTKISSEAYKGLQSFPITYGTATTKFGNCFLGLNEDKVCFIAFFDKDKNAVLNELKKAFPKAVLSEDDSLADETANKIFQKNEDVNVLLKGTEFEMKVWEQLVNLQKGSTASYSDIANALDNPKAIRAVAKAISKNNVSYLIPCHRVISKSGGISKYRWGAERKMKMLREENAL